MLEPISFFSNRWLTTILIDSNTVGFSSGELRLVLEKNNIESRPLWKPMHLQPVFSEYSHFENGVSEDLFQRGLCLPSGSSMTDSHLDRIINIIYDLLK